MNNIDIYDFCKKRWQFYSEQDNGYYLSKHDDLVLSEAAEKFNITKEQVYEIFVAVQKPLAEQYAKQFKTKEDILQELVKITLNNKENPFKK